MQRLSEGRASFTSSFVALARAIFAQAPPAYKGTRDEYACSLIPKRMAEIARTMAQAWQLGAAGREVLRAASLGLFEHVALRTSAIDAALTGCDRLVILGAGLDARAQRMPIKHVIEVDHPATQAYKQKKTKKLPQRPTYVPIDFAQQKLSDVLQKSEAHTFWLMEGVSMYLPRAALLASIEEVRRLAQPGDRFLLTYQPPEPNAARQLLYRMVTDLAGRVGEPFLGVITSADLHAMLDRAAFEVVADEGAEEWSAAYYPSLLQLWVRERLAVCVFSG